jgi:hypothetical protein
VQVPAGTTVTSGAPNTSGGVSSTASSGSIFRSTAGSGAGKKSLLPAFATILAHEAGESNSGKEISGAAEQADAGKLPEESALGLGEEKLIPFASLLPLEGKGSGLPHAEQTPSTTSSKKNVTSHRSESGDSSSVSGKKQSASTSVSEPIPITVPVMAVLPTPVQAKQTVQHVSVEKLSPAPANLMVKSGSASNGSVTPGAADHKEEWNAREVAASSAETATSPSYPAEIDSAKTDAAKIEPQVTLAALNIQAGEITNPAVAANSVAHSIPENLRQGQKFSAEAKRASSLAPAADGIGAGAPAASRAAAEVTAVQASASKSKTQQKIEGNAGSFSVNSVTAASPRSNPATSFAEFSPRANDAASASVGKNVVSSDASPFQRLDSGETAPTLLHSSAHQIAVGVHDPALGWLEVQTQSSAGHISATLTAASTDAHANLTAAMPAITQFLADRNVPLHSLNVDTQGSAAGGGHSQQPGSGQPQQELARQSGHVPQSGAQPLRGAAQDVSATETVSASRISVRA